MLLRPGTDFNRIKILKLVCRNKYPNRRTFGDVSSSNPRFLLPSLKDCETRYVVGQVRCIIELLTKSAQQARVGAKSFCNYHEH